MTVIMSLGHSRMARLQMIMNLWHAKPEDWFVMPLEHKIEKDSELVFAGQTKQGSVG